MSATITCTAGQLAHAASSRPAAWRHGEAVVSALRVHPASKPSAKPFGKDAGVMPVNYRTTAIPGPLEASP